MSVTMVQLARLEGFYWVARTGGFAAAARAFPYPITQPGVHQQVRKLEDELEVRLFERVGKGAMRLTPAGEALYRFVAPFYEGLGEVVRSIRAERFGGTLRVQAAGIALRELVPAWLVRLRESRADIDVELAEATPESLAMLAHGELDVLVDWLPTTPPRVRTTVVGRVTPMLALPANHRVAARRALELDSLANDTFVAYAEGSEHRALQQRALGALKLAPARILTARSAETLLAFVAAGLGYSLVPVLEGSARVHPGVALRPPGVDLGTLDIVAAWRDAGTKNPLVEAALACAPRPAPSTSRSKHRAKAERR